MANNKFRCPSNSDSPIVIKLKANVQRFAVSSQYLRPCYFTDWAHYRPGIGKYDPEAYTPGLCTHILFAFAKINNDFTAGVFDPADLPSDWNAGYFARVNALKQKQPDLKTLLSFGGYSAGTAIFKVCTMNLIKRITVLK